MFFLTVRVCIGLLWVTTEGNTDGEWDRPLVLDGGAGSISGSFSRRVYQPCGPWMTATGTPRHKQSARLRGLALPWENCFKSGLLDIPLLLHICYELRTNICRWSRHHDKDGASRQWSTYPVIYGDFVEIQPSQGGDTPTASVNCNQSGAWPQYARWVDLQLLGVGWSNIYANAWDKIICSRGRIMDLDIQIPCHMDWLMSGYFPIMDNMSPDGLWDCDEESMEGGQYGD